MDEKPGLNGILKEDTYRKGERKGGGRSRVFSEGGVLLVRVGREEGGGAGASVKEKDGT